MPKVNTPLTNLVNTTPVNDERIRDDEVERLGVGLVCRLALAVTERLAAAELALVAVDRFVVLDLDPQAGVTESSSREE